MTLVRDPQQFSIEIVNSLPGRIYQNLKKRKQIKAACSFKSAPHLKNIS